MTCDCPECPRCGGTVHERASRGYVVGLVSPAAVLLALTAWVASTTTLSPALAFVMGSIVGAGYVLVRTDPHLFDVDGGNA